MTHDSEIKLRKNLKRKTRPAISDGALIPMNIYFGCISYDGELLKKFLQLSRGMRKHLLFFIFDSFQPIVEALDATYGKFLEVEDYYLS